MGFIEMSLVRNKEDRMHDLDSIIMLMNLYHTQYFV